MTTEEKQLYIERMKAKAFAYAENVTSDIKIFMPSDEYLECDTTNREEQ